MSAKKNFATIIMTFTLITVAPSSLASGGKKVKPQESEAAAFGSPTNDDPNEWYDSFLDFFGL